MQTYLKLGASEAANLADALFERGVEFPCGGLSHCGGCRIRVFEGEVPITPEMQEVLTPADLAHGWRLACRAQPRGAVTLEIEQWSSPVLGDRAPVPFEPREGLGIAIDLGTTTLVAQLLDLATGEVLDVCTSLNPQGRFGADVMTRIEFDFREPGVLTQVIRSELGRIIGEMLAGRAAVEILVAGNTVMHHLFCGLAVEPLSHVPFAPVSLNRGEFQGRELGWEFAATSRVEFLPCLGGFVGSDILAGVAATALHEVEQPEALVDLGTNGEIVVGGRDGLLCTSTAAGPAFEAGRIRMGMRAAPGAVDHVRIVNGRVDTHVIGGVSPRGLCGSGVVAAVAAALDLGLVQPSGRFAGGRKEWMLAEPVIITQSDIREVQLAKGAVAAGLRLLAGERGLGRLYLAGAFGNYIDLSSAHRIGLLPECAREIVPAGNTSLRGVKLLLLCPSRRGHLIEAIRSRIARVSLAEDTTFQTTFAECMRF
jgi:uncharacterized 2Fe-2S/4Fe-4S cluster protein (DUF4445 family)